MTIEVFGAQDMGGFRRNQEDRWYVSVRDAGALLAVADGMGGHLAGEIAASLAVEGLDQWTPEAGREAETIELFFKEKNDQICSRGEVLGNTMGTTLTLLWLTENGAWYGHIGDSRLCLLRDRRLIRVTEDHNLPGGLLQQGRITPEEARAHPMRNVLLRFLGGDSAVPEIGYLEARPLDLFILTTDGLHGHVSETQILESAESGKCFETLWGSLKDLALSQGSKDNLTFVGAVVLKP